MVATTMASDSLLNHLQSDFPALDFTLSDGFRWAAASQTVFHDPTSPDYAPQLLHETAHGLLGHTGYSYDIDLLKLEREAWEKARQLGEVYSVTITEDFVEDALDSYRDWLHARSRCPKCALTGIQTSTHFYACLVCSQKWQVNDARTCGLKRIKTN